MTKIQVDFENLLETRRHNLEEERRKNLVEQVNAGVNVANAVFGGVADLSKSMSNVAKSFKDLAGTVTSVAGFFA